MGVALAQVHGEIHVEDVKRLKHPLFIGAATNEGTRVSATLQTPAANSLVYADQSC